MRNLRALPLVLLLALTGCGTLLGLSFGDSKIYVGTRVDAKVINDGFGPCSMGPPMPLTLLDFPLSFGLDTGLLPFTLIYELFRPEPAPPGGRDVPPPPPAPWTRADSWYRPPLQDPQSAHATPINLSRIHEVRTGLEKEAEELLTESSSRALTEEEARRISGKPLDSKEELRFYLVRGVILNQGQFVVHAKDRTLWVDHQSKGNSPVPMKRRALVIQTSEIPANVFCSCSMAD